MLDVREKPEFVEFAFLVGVYHDPTTEEAAEELLAELAELVKTLGVHVVGKTLVRVRAFGARLLIGTGKAQEILDTAEFAGADCLVFDNDLSPAQQRNWERLSSLCVIDRQEVILDIFARRARTQEARLQVDLARMQYSLPRLTKAWTHLGRQGGSGGTGDRGEGEAQIELDRRMVRRRISQLQKDLAGVRKRRATQRKERQRAPMPHAAIVGYTNAGKSSLLRKLTGADVMVADMLFATLDTTTRKIDLPSGQRLLLTDTVGFIRQLPHGLVEAFKATLEEAVLADFLIHVLDISQPHVEVYHETTMEVLNELGADEKRIITVFNKLDCVKAGTTPEDVKSHFPDAVFVSVHTGEGIESLVDRIAAMLENETARLRLCVPYTRPEVLAALHEQGKVEHIDYRDEGTFVTASLPRRLARHYDEFLCDAKVRATQQA